MNEVMNIMLNEIKKDSEKSCLDDLYFE